MSTKWTIEDHSTVDKSFGVGNDFIWMRVDYDDVNHMAVEAATKYIKTLLENCWEQRDFSEYYKNELINEWYKDKDLQEEYPNVDKYVIAML